MLALVPSPLRRVKVSRAGNQPFNMDSLGVSFQVSPQGFCPTDTPPVHDEYHPPMEITRARAQESKYVLKTDALSVNIQEV